MQWVYFKWNILNKIEFPKAVFSGYNFDKFPSYLELKRKKKEKKKKRKWGENKRGSLWASLLSNPIGILGVGVNSFLNIKHTKMGPPNMLQTPNIPNFMPKMPLFSPFFFILIWFFWYFFSYKKKIQWHEKSYQQNPVKIRTTCIAPEQKDPMKLHCSLGLALGLSCVVYVEGEEGPLLRGPSHQRYHSGRARILTLCQDLRAKGQFLWGVGLPKGNWGVQRFPRARWRLALECKGRRELDCKTHPSSRDESRP